ncbi:MAG: hypothetical protein ABSG72_05800 [Candidatus Sulfotelmatobacter sp.]
MRDTIMDKFSCFLSATSLALCLAFAGHAAAQSAAQKKTLVVNGKSAAEAVVLIDGHSYVEVETLARIMDATVRFETGRVVLTGPAPDTGAKPEPVVQGLSKEFAQAGISQLAEMREWKGAISSALRSGVAGGTWLAPLLHDHLVRAQESLGKASVAATTDSDRLALQLLKSEFTNLGQWDGNAQASILSLNAEQNLNPSAAQNDPLLAKISDCSKFLNAMLVAGVFADSPSCH